MRDLITLPKAHLHVHLESTARAATVAHWAARDGVPVPPGGPFPGFRAFADRNALVRGLLRSPEDFHRLAVEFCADEAAQGTRYAEVTFTAASHGERLNDLDMPLAAVVEGLREGAHANDITVRLLLDHSRRQSVARLERTVELATRYPEVVGIGLAGDEAYPLAPFAEVLRAAGEAGLHLVHHAGESAGPESVREAVEIGRAQRIGHGFQALADPSVVALLRERGVAVEICVSSNVVLGLVPTAAAHPVRALIEAGVPVTINTDIPDVTGRALADEYALWRTALGFTDEELAEVAIAAAEASFATAQVRDGLITGAVRWLG
ncbi:adenosine deaminase [Actinokineospora baliensis]|uniref:adenosine deaminase n=1 Tax=Actinokineospora baliensis TaxID=547056 RepID=UPI00195E5E4D|nr:adenosine deaminase [Actinokineospora baliensis]MBM7774573.1 adenosine deaminase [Actinokineospora baliensis]